jgi:hypothetical protein
MSNYLSRFYASLLEKGITKEDFESNYYYVGGDRPHRYRYWKLRYIEKQIPPMMQWCECGKNIKEQCYMTCDGVTFLVLGNCCIKRYSGEGKGGRTCEICKEPHKNRINNYCNSCRKKLLCKCNKFKESKLLAKCFLCSGLNLCGCGKTKNINKKSCEECCQECGINIGISNYKVCGICYLTGLKSCISCTKSILKEYTKCYQCYNKSK